MQWSLGALHSYTVCEMVVQEATIQTDETSATIGGQQISIQHRTVDILAYALWWIMASGAVNLMLDSVSVENIVDYFCSQSSC